MKTALVLFALGLCLSGSSSAQEQPAEKIPAELQKLVDGLQWKEGIIPVGGDLATLSARNGYRYLGPKDTSDVVSKIWGNPPQGSTFGMIFPPKAGALDDTWAVILEGFEKEGFVKDEDADKLDADKLLKELQGGQEDGNKERVAAGYAALELVGWAMPPRYDKAARKLYWATDIKRVRGTEHSVNYYVRILGRRGYLVLNAIGGLEQLQDIQAATPEILSMVEFSDGNRYADFDPKTDKVATYGLAGIIAGAVGLKVAAKLGILALLGKKLVILWKPIAIGLAAIGSFFKKIFGKKDQAQG